MQIADKTLMPHLRKCFVWVWDWFSVYMEGTAVLFPLGFKVTSYSVALCLQHTATSPLEQLGCSLFRRGIQSPMNALLFVVFNPKVRGPHFLTSGLLTLSQIQLTDLIPYYLITSVFVMKCQIN
jgi:hypothetical protein